MVDAGHRIVFERNANGKGISHALDKATGEVLQFNRRRGVYELDFQCDSADRPLQAVDAPLPPSAPPFRRPAAQQP